MYRENEVTLAGAVMEAKEVGDPRQMLDAAVRLWLAPAEPSSDGSLVRDVWAALVKAQLEAQAVTELVRVIRAKGRVRADAFVPIAYAASTEQLLDLADAMVAAEYDAYPYVAVVFERLVSDLGEAKPIEALLRKYQAAFGKRTDLWTLGAFTLTTTNVGNRDFVDVWFDGWERRSDAPMWTIAAYVGSLAQVGAARTRMAKIATRAIELLTPDGSAPYLARFGLVEAAIAGEHASLPERFFEADLGGYVTKDPLTDPMVQYANGVRLERKLDSVDFLYDFDQVSGGDVVGSVMFSGLGAVRMMAVARGQGVRPPHWRLVRLYQDMRAPVHRTHQLLSIFLRMMALEKGDPEVLPTAIEWRKARPSELGALVPAWNRLLSARLSWWARTFKL